MPRLTLAFFTAAALYGVGGMAWGVLMGSGVDFTLAPAHHLNLLMWVTLSLMGTFFAFTGPGGPARLGWASFVICNVGLVTLVFTLPRLLVGDNAVAPVAMAGGLITMLGLLTFAAAVSSQWTPAATPTGETA